MKYIAPVESRSESSTGGPDQETGDGDRTEIVDLTRADRGVIGAGSRYWMGVLLAIAVAVTGFGFISHGSASAVDRQMIAVGSRSGPRRAPDPVSGATVPPASGEQALIVTAPADGATVTSRVTLTGGLILVDATTSAALGTVRASVVMNELVLGSVDVDAETIGPLQFKVRVFPPPFATPVVLRLEGARSGAPAVAVSRQFRLNIPSGVGFWDASPTGGVNATGRIRVRIAGYGPMSAGTMGITTKDTHGQVVAAVTVPIAFNAKLPGAAAGQILGLGSFDTTLWLPSNVIGPLSIRATWRDAASGSWLHMDTALPTRDEASSS